MKPLSVLLRNLPRRQLRKVLAKFAKDAEGRGLLEHHLAELRASLAAHTNETKDPYLKRVRDLIADVEMVLGIKTEKAL